LPVWLDWCLLLQSNLREVLMLWMFRLAVLISIGATAIAIVLPFEQPLRLSIDINMPLSEALLPALASLAGFVGCVLLLASALGLLVLRNWARRLAVWATAIAAIGVIPLVLASGVVSCVSTAALALLFIALIAWVSAIALTWIEPVRSRFLATATAATN